MKIVMLIVFMLCLSGCAQSTVKWQAEPNSPVYALTGEAARTMAETLSRNAMTAQGRANEVLKYNGWLYVSLVVMMVGGFVFWGFTRSRYGWVIPAAAACGIGFITFWAEYSQWISLGVLVIALALLVWKSVEYQKERNAK